MTFPHLNRRTHLYLGLLLMPWFVIYGLSSIPFSHPSWGQAYYGDGAPQWTTRAERRYELPVPAGSDGLMHPNRLLAELQAEGRVTNVELARRVGLTAPPCLRRVRGLEEEGVIRGYHADLDPSK
ncbi:MAG: Lrp/AsnC family transcriptional regulator, partial [Acidobacteria bacterium]|nr:Lrp/AsnC family transcriptional regulator [Acidobacteriota bacterium]